MAGSRRIQPNLRWSLKNSLLPSVNSIITRVDLAGRSPTSVFAWVAGAEALVFADEHQLAGHFKMDYQRPAAR